MDETGRGSEGAQAADTSDGESAEIRTFLIADVRGYTLFTHQRGDEAAGKLAAKFAMVARSGVEARGGSVIELRGDEALAVFGSPRQAIRAAVDLMRRFVEETQSDPSLPLPVGIGLDAGEAVPVEGGYRGGALNLAARLCGQAAAGEIVASREVIHLARRIEGVSYVDGGTLSLKGLEEPVNVVRVVPDDDDPALQFATLIPKRVPAPPPPSVKGGRRLRAHPLLVAGLAVVVLVAATAIPLALHHQKGLPAIDANAAGTIDPANGHITGQVPLGEIPGGIAGGSNSIWATLPAVGQVARIDPSSHIVVQRIPVGSDPTGVAFGNGAVWVTNSESRSVSRISPASNTVVQTIEVGNAPSGIAVGMGSVWVANTLDGTVSRIDANTGTVIRTIPEGASPVGVAVGGGSIWVANQTAGTVGRIDPSAGSTDQVVPVGQGPGAVAFGGRHVWVANSQSGTVTRIDPGSGTVSGVAQVGGYPRGLAVGDGSVWVADGASDAVTQIDPTALSVTRTTHLTNAPQALAVSGGALWTTVRGSAAAHKGGTLRVVSSQAAPTSLDPAAAYFLPYNVLTNTNDGLLTFARIGGTAGSTVVPDLAATIPVPTNGGTTYTFKLRPGIRYSDGSTVSPDDVRPSFERAFFFGGPPSYLGSLVGADRCTETACDLSRAIVPDKASGTVTFHLTAPDPLFLDVVAMPVFAIVPAASPRDHVGLHPLPATGPYMVASATSSEVDLVRNPVFHVWSPVAQPAGYADRIVFQFGVGPKRATSAVEQGHADLLLDSPPANRLPEIRTRYSAQIHPYTQLAVDYFFLNTKVSPFNNRNVRRALNYAVDRQHMAKLGTLGGGEPVTCQVLPPSFPGYAPNCPYTLNPSAGGAWLAQDMTKAHALVDTSGTKGAHVVVWTNRTFSADGRYLVGVLDALGYHATMRQIDDDAAYFTYISDSSNRAQIGGAVWQADVPSASNFISPLLTCASFIPDNPHNVNANYSGFCEPRIDRIVKRAEALATADPPRANTMWAEVDRKIVDQAPWVPFTTPSGIYLVSPRVGNFQYNPVIGTLVSQMWVT